MKKQWYRTKEITYYKELWGWDTASGTERLLNKFYLEIDADEIITICFKNAVRVINLLTFKEDKIFYKDLDAILRLTPRSQMIFIEVIKKHLTATINI